jgi:hypothetical protein
VRRHGLVPELLHLRALRAELTDEWSCMCDDDCPHCGARHMSPVDSDDLTHIIEARRGEFVALRSPQAAEHSPDYFEMASFATRSAAEDYVAKRSRTLADVPDPANIC